MTKKETLKLVTTEYDGLNRVGKKYQNDYEIVKAAINFWPYQIRYASKYLQTNKELGLIAVKEDGLLLSDLAYNLRCDDDIIKAALKQDGTAIRYAIPNREIVEECIEIAIKSNPFAVKYIPTCDLTIEQAKYCLEKEPSLFAWLDKDLRNNPELIKFVDKLDSDIHLHDKTNNIIYENPFDNCFDDNELPF